MTLTHTGHRLTSSQANSVNTQTHSTVKFKTYDLSHLSIPVVFTVLYMKSQVKYLQATLIILVYQSILLLEKDSTFKRP